MRGYRERAGTLQRLRVRKLNGDWADWKHLAVEQARQAA
jgi:hypothetical protein